MDEGVTKIAALRSRVNAIGLKDQSKIFNSSLDPFLRAGSRELTAGHRFLLGGEKQP